MSRACLTIFGLVLIAHPLLGQCRADVAGTVFDDAGSPVRGALVSFQEKQQTAGAYAQRFYETNEGGVFKAALELTAPGLYWVLAKKEDSGYPDNTFAFYADFEPPQVELDCGSSVSGIVVKLGPKCAYISRINVVDAVTGAPVEDASIKFSRRPMIAGLSEASLSRSTRLQEVSSADPGFPIPSNTQISYQVSAVGYVTSAPKMIQIAPSKIVAISVKLQRSTQ